MQKGRRGARHKWQLIIWLAFIFAAVCGQTFVRAGEDLGVQSLTLAFAYQASDYAMKLRHMQSQFTARISRMKGTAKAALAVTVQWWWCGAGRTRASYLGSTASRTVP